MEVSYTESFNKTKKERQQRAAMQALEFNGVLGELNIKKRLEREKGRVKEEGPHCNFQANVKFLQNIQILKLWWKIYLIFVCFLGLLSNIFHLQNNIK